MAILEDYILITINNNHKHYRQLGYILPTYTNDRGETRTKLGSKMLVKVLDLPKSSNYEITKICDQCTKKVGNVPYFALLKQRKNNNGKDICKKCWLRNREIKKAEGNSLMGKFPEIAHEWIKCLKEGCEDYTPEMVSVKSNFSVLWKCAKGDCNHEWTAKISDRTGGSGCPACWGRVVSDKNRLSLLYPNLINEWHPTMNGELKPSDVTYAAHKEVWWMCKYEHEWKTPVHSRTIMKVNCPICSESKGEKKIRQWLNENSLRFEGQKEFHNLIGTGGGLLSYDFYLPNHNLLIEYQGQFHDGKGNEYIRKNLNVQQEHDKRKREYAENNNYRLLEIWYWDFDNIGKILKEELNGNQT